MVECQDKTETGLRLLKVDPELGKRREGELAKFKQKRDAQALSSSLAALHEAAEGTANLMTPIVAVVRAGATVGEISDALRNVFGEYDRQR